MFCAPPISSILCTEKISQRMFPMLTRRGFLLARAPEKKADPAEADGTVSCDPTVHERLHLVMTASLEGKNATAEERAAMIRANVCPFCGVKLADALSAYAENKPIS